MSIRETAWERAERDINNILAHLEEETGSLVESIEIIDMDVTSITSSRKELSRRVSIDLQRIPGSKWAGT